MNLIQDLSCSMTGLKQGKIQKFVVAQFRRVKTTGDAVETWACNKEASTG